MAGIFGFKRREPRSGSHQVNGYIDDGCDEEISGLSQLYCPEQDSVSHTRQDSVSHTRDVADVLSEMGKITGDQLSQVRQIQKEKPNCDICETVRDLKLVDEPDISMAQAGLYDMEFRRIEPEQVDKGVFDKLELGYVRSNRIMPISVRGDTLMVATSRPSDLFIIEDVKRQAQMNVETVVCLEEDIDKVCEAFNDEKIDCDLDDIINDMTDVEIVHDQEDESEDLEKMAGQSPVIKFVNYLISNAIREGASDIHIYLISNAIREGASDIHIEPKERFMRTRYRIDGVLFEMKQSPLKMHPAIVSRVKIMANLDISERRLPQDGKIKVSVGGRAIDLRVSTLPTNHGEKVVIRVLDSKTILIGLDKLGMEPDAMAAFNAQITLPHGILLVTGPTGSGKSTTLYTALGQMDGEKLNLSTVEDPVEYQLDFCNQVQINDKIGLDFATRDNETARIAVQAALTGHLVLSTLHTNDAAASITRLVDIGIEPYLIAASLNAVLAQRLVRKICPECKQVCNISEHAVRYVKKAGIKPEQVYYGAGCDKCRGSGYLGRVGIYEQLVVDEQLRDMINKDASVNNMRRVFHESGRRSLYDDGIVKVKQGLTTIEEVLRVTEVYGKNENEVFVENMDSD